MRWRVAPAGVYAPRGSASEVLSTRLYQAATRMFQRHAAQIELQSLLIMPELSVEMRYLPHDGNVEIGLLDARLVGLRAELTSRPELLQCDLQLDAIYARDLTDTSLPYLATSGSWEQATAQRRGTPQPPEQAMPEEAAKGEASNADAPNSAGLRGAKCDSAPTADSPSVWSRRAPSTARAPRASGVF